jgi:putative toxin-antitoxin system antitoxin component (TIGR02293 family)
MNEGKKPSAQERALYRGRVQQTALPAEEFGASEGVQSDLVLREHFTAALPTQLVERIQQGMPIRRFDEVRNALAIPSEQLAAKVGMSRATFHRRQQEGRLRSDESDKLVRFARLILKAISVFESEVSARTWLRSPQQGLGGAVPLDYAETEVGAREVENLLGRIEHGVYS